jgi:DNA-3-methyladenine glycosylase II
MLTTNGIIDFSKSSDSSFFESMARILTGQQLSKKAASTIWDRVKCRSAFYEVGIIDFSDKLYVDELRNCGLSKYKIRAMLQLSCAVKNNEINIEKLKHATHEDIRSELSRLWGFGLWSADMMAIFFFGCQDVWAPEDAALKRGMEIVSAGDPQVTDELLVDMRPYRSYLALHIWKALDDKIFDRISRSKI